MIMLSLTKERNRHFNSIKVQLELPMFSPPLAAKIDFNSIKVQLERYNGAFCDSLKSISIP